MAQDNKIRMPSGMGGLSNYGETESKFKIKPIMIVIAAIVVMIFVLLLIYYGPRLMGL